MRQAIVAASLYGSKTAFAKQCGALVCRLPVNLLSCSLLIAFAAVKVMRRGVIAGLKVHTSTPCCLVNVAPCSLAEQFCLAAFLTMSCCDLKQRKRGGLAVISPPLSSSFWSQHLIVRDTARQNWAAGEPAAVTYTLVHLVVL